VPELSVGFLQSRIDHQEMVQWQEGGGEAALQNSEGSTPEPPQPWKFDHPTICGIDKRPFFPTVLILSLLWSVCMMSLQIEAAAAMFGGAYRCHTFFFLLYTFTIGSAVYTSLANPGLMPVDEFEKWQAGERPLPMRAHKHWLYKRPVLRFHQYCRWITNAVGLKNHRAYMCMLIGFVSVAVCDALLDLVLIPMRFPSGSFISNILLLLHLVYSCYFAWYATPLLRMHSAFICRNELTQEWKNDEFYIVYSDVSGEKIAVNELDTDEYNRLFDDFIYDSSKNAFDKGWVKNCLTFWLTNRSNPQEWGEF